LKGKASGDFVEILRTKISEEIDAKKRENP